MTLKKKKEGKKNTGERSRNLWRIFGRVRRGRRHCVVVAPFIIYPVRFALPSCLSFYTERLSWPSQSPGPRAPTNRTKYRRHTSTSSPEILRRRHLLSIIISPWSPPTACARLRPSSSLPPISRLTPDTESPDHHRVLRDLSPPINSILRLSEVSTPFRPSRLRSHLPPLFLALPLLLNLKPCN